MNELDKKTVASQLKEAAKLLDVLGEDSFKAKALLSGSRALENYSGDFAELMPEDYAEQKLTSIRGIGKSLAEDIYAIRDLGSLPLLDELYEKVPEGVRDLFSVSGLGAKKIALLWQEDIDSLEKLIAACESGQVAELKGFGKKSAESFVPAAQFAIEAKKRMRIDVATVLADSFEEQLLSRLAKLRMSFAGSLRRQCETVGDIDVIVTGHAMSEIVAALHDFTEEIVVTEPTVTFKYLDREFELMVTNPNTFGAILAVWTGSIAFRHQLMAQVELKGLILDDDGLQNKEGEVLDTPSEDDFFTAISMPYIIPERREFSVVHPIEGVLELEDIRGLVHNHSTWSDGAHSLEEMLEEAIELGFSYLAIADHSKSSAVASGLSIEEVEAQGREIELLRQDLDDEEFQLLHGMEVDIMTDGTLDYPDDVLAQLDYCVVSVHQNFTLSQADQTARIIKAVENPYANILAHPTGRLILRRPEYALDIEAVIDACADTGTVIELNASPYRLDLDWRWIITAKEKGCKFSINPDAHSIHGYDVLQYGVAIARKAGLTADDVVNTQPTGKAFAKTLRRLKKSKK